MQHQEITITLVMCNDYRDCWYEITQVSTEVVPKGLQGMALIASYSFTIMSTMHISNSQKPNMSIINNQCS